MGLLMKECIFKIGQEVLVVKKPFVYSPNGKKGFVSHHLSGVKGIVKKCELDYLNNGDTVFSIAVETLDGKYEQWIAEECLSESK